MTMVMSQVKWSTAHDLLISLYVKYAPDDMSFKDLMDKSVFVCGTPAFPHDIRLVANQRLQSCRRKESRRRQPKGKQVKEPENDEVFTNTSSAVGATGSLTKALGILPQLFPGNFTTPILRPCTLGSFIVILFQFFGCFASCLGLEWGALLVLFL